MNLNNSPRDMLRAADAGRGHVQLPRDWPWVGDDSGTSGRHEGWTSMTSGTLSTFPDRRDVTDEVEA